MPGKRNTQASRRLTKAGLTLVSTATLLLMVWAVFPSTAFAGSGTQSDPYGPADKVSFCHYAGSDTGGGSGNYVTPSASVTATGPAGHIGHAFDVIPSYYFQQNHNSPVEQYLGVNWPTLTHLPSSPVDYTPLLGTSAAAFIASGCAAPRTTTTVTTTTTTGTTTQKTTTGTTTASTTTTSGSSTTSTTSQGPIVGPTSIEPTDEERTTTAEGLAFTGVESIFPLGGIVVLLMTVGSGLLWAGARRRHDEP